MVPFSRGFIRHIKPEAKKHQVQLRVKHEVQQEKYHTNSTVPSLGWELNTHMPIILWDLDQVRTEIQAKPNYSSLCLLENSKCHMQEYCTRACSRYLAVFLSQVLFVTELEPPLVISCRAARCSRTTCLSSLFLFILQSYLCPCHWGLLNLTVSPYIITKKLF